MLPDYRALLPKTSETKETYCMRLESDGYEEMYIRKALAEHFAMKLEEMAEFFNDFELARLRHLKMITELHRGYADNDTSFARKISENLGIPKEKANILIKRFHQASPEDLTYIR